jgi:hypothetical protein
MEEEDQDFFSPIGEDSKNSKKNVSGKELKRGDILDSKFGFSRIREGTQMLGFLINMRPVRILKIIYE